MKITSAAILSVALPLALAAQQPAGDPASPMAGVFRRKLPPVSHIHRHLPRGEDSAGGFPARDNGQRSRTVQLNGVYQKPAVRRHIILEAEQVRSEDVRIEQLAGGACPLARRVEIYSHEPTVGRDVE